MKIDGNYESNIDAFLILHLGDGFKTLDAVADCMNDEATNFIIVYFIHYMSWDSILIKRFEGTMYKSDDWMVLACATSKMYCKYWQEERSACYDSSIIILSVPL